MATTFSGLQADIEALKTEIALVRNSVEASEDQDAGQDDALSEALSKTYEHGNLITELQSTVNALQEDVYTRLQNIESVLS